MCGSEGVIRAYTLQLWSRAHWSSTNWRTSRRERVDEVRESGRLRRQGRVEEILLGFDLGLNFGLPIVDIITFIRSRPE